MLRCIHGVGAGHVNVHVKCIRCRCYVAYMACSRALPLDAMRMRLQRYVGCGTGDTGSRVKDPMF